MDVSPFGCRNSDSFRRKLYKKINRTFIFCKTWMFSKRSSPGWAWLLCFDVLCVALMMRHGCLPIRLREGDSLLRKLSKSQKQGCFCDVHSSPPSFAFAHVLCALPRTCSALIPFQALQEENKKSGCQKTATPHFK